MYFSPHAVSAFNIETCKLHKSRKYVLNKRHVKAMELLARNKQIGKKDIKYLSTSYQRTLQESIGHLRQKSK